MTEAAALKDLPKEEPTEKRVYLIAPLTASKPTHNHVAYSKSVDFAFTIADLDDVLKRLNSSQLSGFK
jgi:hypothetical protein